MLITKRKVKNPINKSKTNFASDKQKPENFPMTIDQSDEEDMRNDSFKMTQPVIGK